MFHKIVQIEPLEDFRLKVRFKEEVTKVFDVKPLFDVWESFQRLKSDPKLFFQVQIAPDGLGIIWNDDLDLSSEDLFEFGED